jgi:small-conductance mechanosensitive channel
MAWVDVFWEWVQIPLVSASIILVGSILVAKLTDILISRLLFQLVRRTVTQVDDKLIDILHGPIFWSVVLIGVDVGIHVLNLEDQFEFMLIGFAKTMGVLIWTIAGFKISTVLLTGLSRVHHRVRWVDSQTLPLFDNLAKIIALGIGSYMLLLTWNVDVSAWLASAGILTITIGFAAKDTVANLFSGLFIMADAPYKIDDFIVLDTGERGRVIQIGLRSTRILTRDDIEVTIPNAIIANAKITNESGGPWEKERIRATIGVAYGSDLDQVRKVLTEAVKTTKHIDLNEEPRIRFREFGPSSLVFQVMCWVDEPILRGRALDSLNENIYNKLNEADITIPFPQRVVHLPQNSLDET